MHTFKSQGIIFRYNQDMSGGVIVEDFAPSKPISVEIPGQALLEFVAEYVRRNRIAVIEQQTVNDLFS